MRGKILLEYVITARGQIDPAHLQWQAYTRHMMHGNNVL